MDLGKEGCDENDLIRALDALGCQFAEFGTEHHGEARAWLLTHAAHCPLIICVDQWEHWVCIAGQCGDRLWLLDPAREPWNTKHNGVWPLLPKTIIKRWRTARRIRDDGPAFYGLALLNAKRA